MFLHRSACCSFPIRFFRPATNPACLLAKFSRPRTTAGWLLLLRLNIPTPPVERNKISARGASTLPIDSTFSSRLSSRPFLAFPHAQYLCPFFAVVPQKASFLAFPLLVFLDPFFFFHRNNNCWFPSPNKKLAKLACVCVPRSSVSSFGRWWCDKARRRGCVVCSAATMPLLRSILRKGGSPFFLFCAEIEDGGF